MSLQQLREAVEESGYRFPEGAVVREGEIGDSVEMTRDLLDRIVAGSKRATCSQGWLYKETQEPLPRPGDFEIIRYPGGRELIVIGITKVEIFPFAKVPAEFAEKEGEGGYAAWREAHLLAFQRECEAYERRFLEADPIVCVQFDLAHVTF